MSETKRNARTDDTQEQGWTARLELEFAHREGSTILSRRRHDGPLVVQRPFFPEPIMPVTCMSCIRPAVSSAGMI